MIATGKTHVARRQGTVGKTDWLQLAVIRDESVALLHLEPALLSGWILKRIDRQCGDDWAGLNADAIVEFKRQADSLGTVLTDAVEIRQALELEARGPRQEGR